MKENDMKDAKIEDLIEKYNKEKNKIFDRKLMITLLVYFLLSMFLIGKLSLGGIEFFYYPLLAVFIFIIMEKYLHFNNYYALLFIVFVLVRGTIALFYNRLVVYVFYNIFTLFLYPVLYQKWKIYSYKKILKKNGYL